MQSAATWFSTGALSSVPMRIAPTGPRVCQPYTLAFLPVCFCFVVLQSSRLPFLPIDFKIGCLFPALKVIFVDFLFDISFLLCWNSILR